MGKAVDTRSDGVGQGPGRIPGLAKLCFLFLENISKYSKFFHVMLPAL